MFATLTFDGERFNWQCRYCVSMRRRTVRGGFWGSYGNARGRIHTHDHVSHGAPYDREQLREDVANA